MGSAASVAWAYARQTSTGTAPSRMYAAANPLGAGSANPYYQPPYATSGADFAPPPGPPPGQYPPPPFAAPKEDDSLPGYGVGNDGADYDGDVKRRSAENPFADFEQRR